MSQQEERRDVQINIIHISDLHMGMSGQKWMWPTFKTIFFNDLRNQYEKTGPWDLVIFSGDLTQSAHADEYAALTAALTELWDLFNALGCSPRLFVVPGNHDLQRLAQSDAHAIVLGNWWDTPEIHGDFWQDAASPYRSSVSEAFAAYTTWTKNLAGTKIPLIADEVGLLPGDVSARLEKDGTTLGLVGLNSAWLQLNNRNGSGKLNVHAHQLLNVTGSDPDGWVSSNTFNLLVTHHPTTWLHPKAVEHWNSEIYVNTRFGAHLFGHMHEGVTGQVNFNGGVSKLAIQAPSIFGLETLGDGSERNHGYSCLRLMGATDGQKIKIWPRFAFQTKDGARRLIADPNWELKEDACEFDVRGQVTTSALHQAPHSSNDEIKTPEVSLVESANASRILGSLKKSNAYTRAAASVRKVEQQLLWEELSCKRRAWLVDTWGTGGDEFINLVSTRILGATTEIYCLPVGTFDGEESFLASVRPRLGCTLEELCRALDQRPCILVLDDVSIEGGTRSKLEQELLFIVATLLEFSEYLHVIIRSRSRPAGLDPFIQLGSLDEADVTVYVTSHEQTSNLSPDAIARIFRHSGGLPTRIDTILRGIEVVGTQAVYDLDVDIVGKAATRPDDIPQALVEAIQELNCSDDEHSRRAAMLLKVLSLFPQGEPLARVRRFFGAKAFYPSHATLLLERGLIDLNPIMSLEGTALSQDQGNALMARRPVREYLVQSLSATELKGLNSKALALYFGDDWALRGIHSPSDLKFSSARTGSLEIENASTLILREARAATESKNHGRVKAALMLSESFVGQLKRGDHFRGVAQFLDDGIKIFEEYVSARPSEQEAKEPLGLASLLHSQASALRMVGQHERAHKIATEINLEGQSNALKEKILLTIAMCKESLKAPSEEIIAVAETCRKINPRGWPALHARYVITSNTPSPDKTARLRLLYEEARKKGCNTVANNIGLELSAVATDVTQRNLLLKDAMKSGISDHYNAVRALLRIARISIDESGTLTQQQFDECIRAYSYLYNQRLDNLFESCHQILWDMFKARQDEKNLLTLYRYSSLVWRLRRKSETEQKYRNALTEILGSRLSKSILIADRELRYFISRGASSAGELLSP